MPLKNGHLTPKERAFSNVMAKVDDAPYAAAKAGYASPEVAGYQLMARPGVRDEVTRVRERERKRLITVALPKAVDKIIQILDDPKATDGATGMAVRETIKQALGDVAGDSGDKEPSDMSYDEIERTVAALRARQAELAENAKDVTPDPGVFD